MTTRSPRSARIHVVGAGPGGLTCARILQRHGIAVTVHDRDTHRDARDQGGTLDLRTDDGQLALAEAGLLDGFDALARPEGQEMRQLNTRGDLLGHHVPGPDERFKPEIDRRQLRDLLLDSLAEDTVRWGSRLDHVDAAGDGTHLLHFTDGRTEEADLVIGADGAFSRVRPLVSAAVPRYTGVTFLEARFDDVDERHPAVAELVGAGSAAAADGERGLFAQRNADAHIRVYIMQRAAVDWVAAAGLSTQDTAAMRAWLCDAYAAWSPLMRRLVSDNDGRYVDRPLHVLPVPHTWDPVPGVTLLGDAAHLMPPVGVGVNLAMLDACELALALASAATVDEAVRGYEATMLPRSVEMAEMTADGPDHLLTADQAAPPFGPED